MRRISIGLLIAFLAVALFLGLTHPGRTAVKAALFVSEVVPGLPARPLLWVSDPPILEEVSYADAHGSWSGALLRPDGAGPYGAVVFFLGVDPDLEDPDFLRVTEAIARTGIVVLIHRSGAFDEVRVSREEADGLVAAFEYLAKHPAVDPERIGMAGFSVGGSMALIAAADERIRDQVALVNAFGAYNDVLDVAVAVTTRRIWDEESVEDWAPQQLAVDILRRGVVNTLSRAEERETLSALLDGGSSPTEKVVEGLSPEGGIILGILTATEVEEAQRLIGLLPDDVRERLAAISPKGSLAQLRTRVFLMHDTGDDLIPYVESRRLRAGLEGVTDVRYSEFEIFEHVNPSGVELSLTFARGMAKLFLHLYRVMLEVA